MEILKNMYCFMHLSVCLSKCKNIIITGVVILHLLLFVDISYESLPGVLHDYCEQDNFQAECPPGQIVVFEEARFGRMELGRCLTAEFGYFDCYSDVLSVLDRWCSGRQSCNVVVFHLVGFRNACTEQLPSYLQARYTCQTVVVPDSHCCQTAEGNVILTEDSGLISNYMTHSSGCGGINCPWLLQAPQGQIINISLFDFSTFEATGGVTGGDKRRDSQDRRCNIYAKIREEASGGIVTVCSGQRRHRHLYTTVSSSVEIRIINTGDSGDESAYFLIHFQAFGCSNPTTPANGLVDRQGDRAFITCSSNNVQWEIMCRGGEWHGEVGRCTEDGMGFGEEADNSYFTKEVYMVLVIAIAFVLAVAIITSGVVCLYRHWSQIPSDGRGRPGQLSHMQSPDGTYLASEFNYSLPRQNKGYDTVGYKYHSPDRNTQSDPRFMANIRTGPEKDKGYYSDRTYESPICDHGHVTSGGSKGYDTVNSVGGGKSCHDASLDRNLYPRANASSETPTLLVGDIPRNLNAHSAT